MRYRYMPRHGRYRAPRCSCRRCSLSRCWASSHSRRASRRPGRRARRTRRRWRWRQAGRRRTRPAGRSAQARTSQCGRQGPPRQRDTEPRRACGCPGAVIPNPLALKDTPFQPWAKALLEDRQSNELEPHTRCKPSGVARQFLTPYGVEFVELPRAAARLHLRHRRPAHLPHDLHGRPHASDEPRARPTTATRSAGGRATRWSSTRSGSTKASGWIAMACRTPTSCTRSRRFTRTDCRGVEVRADGGRPGRLHQAVDRRHDAALGGWHRALRVPVPAVELRARADGRRSTARSIAARSSSRRDRGSGIGDRAPLPRTPVPRHADTNNPPAVPRSSWAQEREPATPAARCDASTARSRCR